MATCLTVRSLNNRVSVIPNVECPICRHNLKVDIQKITLNQFGLTKYLILHGKPQHALIVYIDTHGKIRGTESIKHIQYKPHKKTKKQKCKHKKACPLITLDNFFN